MPRRRRIELKIVLETNAIFTDSENHLLRREISELVRNNRGDANLTIQWILPETVLQERSYQMQREAASLLPHLTRLERVTGLSLNITEETIRTKIAESVDRQVSEHRLIVLPASYDRIDWGRLVGDAVNRRPPFERKGEKGFRDALIAETFIQFVEASPRQLQRCRLVLLTNDGLLTESVRKRVAGRENVQILASADELLGLINTLLSTVPEDYVARLQAKASDYFYKSAETPTGLFLDVNVRSTIENQCRNELNEKPPEADRRSSGTWFLALPRFVKKDRQRVHWASRISIEAKAYKQHPQPQYENVTYATQGTVANMGLGTLGSLYGKTNPSEVTFNIAGQPRSATIHSQTVLGDWWYGNETLIASGKTVVDVNWSVSVSVHRAFSRPRIESIEFVETTWERA